ncbi:MAG: hypothetical protein JWN74_3589 [Acidobacteriaceae bacterium]|nr:hypothetical protein [Acidobacteriaceae bacterium]
MALKALVVDDEPNILITLGLVLKSEGLDVDRFRLSTPLKQFSPDQF